MPTTVPKLATIGEVAKLLEVPPRRIEYILRSRGHIKPRATAAGARCFDDDAIEQIRCEIVAIDAKRRRRGGAA